MCKSLGYNSGKTVAKNPYGHHPESTVLMAEITCSGEEANVGQCNIVKKYETREKRYSWRELRRCDTSVFCYYTQ